MKESPSVQMHEEMLFVAVEGLHQWVEEHQSKRAG
jgi:hypothetical protein